MAPSNRRLEMQSSKQGLWHPVGAGQSQGLVFWKFTGKEISSFSSAVGGGFTGFFILQNFELPVALCLTVGIAIPVLTSIYLLTLVCGKPSSYATCFLERLWLRLTDRSLFCFKPHSPDEEIR